MEFHTPMRLWIDLANSPHVPFFKVLINRFTALGHDVETTARDFAETVSLAAASGLTTETVGGHGGRQVSAKATNLMGRAWALGGWARRRGFDLAISHNSYSQILAARALRIKSVTLMDYEYQPANHLAFRLTSRLIVPASFPAKRLRRYGASRRKVFRYNGTKEDVYLADFNPDPTFLKLQLYELGIEPGHVVVLVRPPAYEALYHRFQNKLFDDALGFLLANENVRVVLLPRNDKQRLAYAAASNRLIIPPGPLDGANLIAASDLVISAGGTINREAAALGTPAASLYAGKWAAVDEQLVKEGRLKRIANLEDFRELPLTKKAVPKPRRSVEVIDEVIQLILG